MLPRFTSCARGPIAYLLVLGAVIAGWLPWAHHNVTWDTADWQTANLVAMHFVGTLGLGFFGNFMPWKARNITWGMMLLLIILDVGFAAWSTWLLSMGYKVRPTPWTLRLDTIQIGLAPLLVCLGAIAGYRVQRHTAARVKWLLFIAIDVGIAGASCWRMIEYIPACVYAALAVAFAAFWGYGAAFYAAPEKRYSCVNNARFPYTVDAVDEYAAAAEFSRALDRRVSPDDMARVGYIHPDGECRFCPPPPAGHYLMDGWGYQIGLAVPSGLLIPFLPRASRVYIPANWARELRAALDPDVLSRILIWDMQICHSPDNGPRPPCRWRPLAEVLEEWEADAKQMTEESQAFADMVGLASNASWLQIAKAAVRLWKERDEQYVFDHEESRQDFAQTVGLSADASWEQIAKEAVRLWKELDQ